MVEKRNGEYVGAFTSYGYIKDPKDKHKLIVDTEAANIVRKIFSWNVKEGLGNIAICHKLNNLGILNPTGHKKLELKQNYNNYGIQDNVYTWTPSTVRNILHNEVYIGNTIQGKRKTKSYKLHQVEAVPEIEWVRVEHTHEPIIDQETFEKAQELSKEDTKVSQKTQQLSIWAGLLKCNDCKRAMNKKSSTNKSGKKYEYYICSTYKKKSKQLCTKHSIQEEKIEKAVLEAINFHLAYFMNTERIERKMNDIFFQNIKNTNIENMILSKQNEISKTLNYKRKLYEDWKNEDITRQEYLEYKQKYETDIEKLNQNIETLKYEQQVNEGQNIEKRKWLEKFKQQRRINQLTREMILELIDCIYIHENDKITIKFKFENELEKIENNPSI